MEASYYTASSAELQQVPLCLSLADKRMPFFANQQPSSSSSSAQLSLLLFQLTEALIERTSQARTAQID